MDEGDEKIDKGSIVVAFFMFALFGIIIGFFSAWGIRSGIADREVRKLNSRIVESNAKLDELRSALVSIRERSDALVAGIDIAVARAISYPDRGKRIEELTRALRTVSLGIRGIYGEGKSSGSSVYLPSGKGSVSAQVSRKDVEKHLRELGRYYAIICGDNDYSNAGELNYIIRLTPEEWLYGRY